jgi:excisionase family DNA binding protein
MSTRESTDFCTTREAANLLGISVRTAQLWVENGTLEAWKTEGGHRRISLSSIQRLRRERPPMRARYTPGEPQDGREAYSRTLRILVVDEDEVLLRLYRTHLESWGLAVSVAVAQSSVEGLILLGRHSPDLLITDLSMAEPDGFSMVHALTRSTLREGTAILVISALTPQAIAARGGLPQDTAVLTKPVPFDQVRTLCERLIARRGALAA